jgi:hypothetical protein
MFQRLASFALLRSVLLSSISVSGLASAAPPDAPAAPVPAPSDPAVANTAPAASPEEGLLALARDLELVVTESGPDMPWTLHLRNRGSTPIGLMADPGLLWFEVAVPGASSPRLCRLPEPLWPKGMRRRAEVLLPAGERFSRRFDPRFFCFADLVQTALVPGARVIPHFGWPHEPAATVVKGKRAAPPPPAKPSFVAWVSQGTPPPTPPVDADPDTDENNAEPTPETPWQPPTEGLENVVGAAIVLSPAYAKWSERPPATADGLQVAMLAGSDAEDERGALVTVGLGNAGQTSQLVVVRRELVSFNVLGPDGPFECETGELGPPDVESFTAFGPRSSEQLVVRLIEMCPAGGFSRPGLYEVHATWHGKFSGQAHGLDAFLGTVKSPRPALVRVRSGERSSFLRAAPMVATGEAPKAAPRAPAPEAAPADNAPEAPPADDAPGDREGAPDDALPVPEPPAAPEGTSVE